jgi:hypothetical protein
MAAATAAPAQRTDKYTVMFQGKPSGTQTTVTGKDGRITVDFTYRQNGRGPDTREEIVLGEDGLQRSHRVTGKSTFGAPMGEAFERTRAAARWHSNADRGDAVLTGAAGYFPVSEISPAVYAILVRAVTRQPGGRLAVLPAGEIAVERLAEARLSSGDRTQAAVLYAINGLSFQPHYVWLTPELRLFADLWPGWIQLIEAGWEAQVAELERRQIEAQAAQLAALAAKLAHRVPDPILIRNARVFDAERARLGAAADVYVHRGRIAALYPAGSAPQQAATVIDAGGRVLMPALFDMHDHADSWRNLMQIAGGVTTTRDMGSDNAVLADQIARIDRGEAIGPRIVTAGFIEGQSEHAASGGFTVASLDDIRRAIDWYAQRGYPQVKLYNSFRREWVAETTAYAHARGLRVSGHVPAFMRAEEVVAMGYDELQHMNQVFLNFLAGPGDDSRTLVRFYLIAENAHALDLDSRRVKKFVSLLKDRGTTVDPTLTTFSFMTYKQGDANPRYAPVLAHLPAAVQRNLHTNTLDVTDANVARYRASYAKMVEFAGRLHRAGVPLVAGTDDTAGFALHSELELFVQAGIPAPEVLRIATWDAAKVSRTLDRLGSVTPGKLADLILVDGDPTTNISDIRRIALVMKEGTIFHPSEVYPAVGVKPFVEPVKVGPAK